MKQKKWILIIDKSSLISDNRFTVCHYLINLSPLYVCLKYWNLNKLRNILESVLSQLFIQCQEIYLTWFFPHADISSHCHFCVKSISKLPYVFPIFSYLFFCLFVLLIFMYGNFYQSEIPMILKISSTE